jgi:hypothetical protein
MQTLDLTAHKTIANFMKDDNFIRLVVGPIGSGKSTGVLCGEIMRRALMQKPGPDNIRYFKALVVRNTMPDLKKTTIKTWHGMMPATVGTWKQNPPEHSIIEPPGQDGSPGLNLLVEFVGLDTAADAGKLLSWEGTLICFNEVKEINYEIVNAATGRVGRYPNEKQCGCMPSWYGIIMDTNPYNSGHWLDKLEKDCPKTWTIYRQPPAVIEMEKAAGGWRSLEAKHPLVIGDDYSHYIHKGGGLLWAVNPKAENLKYLPINFQLDPMYKDGMEEDPAYMSVAPLQEGGYYGNLVQGKEPAWIRIYVQGYNGSLNSDNSVIPEFDRAKMVQDRSEYNETLAIECGIDFGAGTLNPAAVFGQRDPISGSWMVIKELVCGNMGLAQFAEQMLVTINQNFGNSPNLRIWGDPAGLQRDGVSMKTYFEHLRLAGLHAMPAPTNSIDVRIECIRTPMTRFYKGNPGIIFNPDCRILIEALEEKWNYKRLNVAGEVRYDDKPCKDHPHSDVADALGYMLAGGGEHTKITTGGGSLGDGFILDTSWDVI